MEYNFTENICGVECSFVTNDECFSPKNADKGTIAMLSACKIEQGETVIDLGCGYGTVGIWAAHFTKPENIYMLDINTNALECARKNAELNGFECLNIIESNGCENLDRAGFDIILSNPPYHTDFSVAKMFIEKGFNRLKVGGHMYMVTKRLDWYKNKLSSVFGGVKVNEIDGYYVFIAEKRQPMRADKSKKR
ncbi:MAG: methyltransferase domain-containing protein [Ruminococcaceae bacterium]|nr:methyltransferase domain-containing protein [Oscillospiraceae bacterium]